MERTSPKVNERYVFSHFSSRNAVHSMTWRGPLVNLFPLAFSGLFWLAPFLMRNAYFCSGFMSTTLAHGNH